jgi:drug/metabolite transporter (DMT)-like permease
MTSQADIPRPAMTRRSLGHVFLGTCLFFGVSAQLLLKFATLQAQVKPGDRLFYFWIGCGLIVYAFGTGFWVLCLRYLDLSYAYPFTGLTYVLVLAASWLLLDERASIPRLVGVLAICMGVALIPTRVREHP